MGVSIAGTENRTGQRAGDDPYPLGFRSPRAARELRPERERTKSFDLVDTLLVEVDRIQRNFEPMQRQIVSARILLHVKACSKFGTLWTSV